MEGVNLAIRDRQNLVEDTLGIFGRFQFDKPKVISSPIEDEGDNSIVGEGVLDCLHLD